ncbi:hypothetical protein H4582DRAFT_2073701 [Lactarius indigo]|nr:hypothetical protein H4582DRAFT_2073701 [Lactarius indigo]
MNSAVPEHPVVQMAMVNPHPQFSTDARLDSDDYDFSLREDIVIARPARTAPITPRMTKCLKLSSEDVAHLYNIDPNQLISFAEAPTMLDMLLLLQVCLLKVEKMLNKVQRDTYLESDEFKAILQDQLLIALLSPGIPTYITDVTVWMMIKGSFRDNGKTLHIGLLAQRLLSPKGVLISLEHWAQFAFLQSAFQDFVKITQQKKPTAAHCSLRMHPKQSPNLVGLKCSELEALGTRAGEGQSADNGDNNDEYNINNDNRAVTITGKEYTPQQFWNYVDDYLEYIRTELFAGLPDPATWNRKITWFFNEALQVNLFNYQSGSKIPLHPSGNQLPVWQETLHNSAHWD